MPISGNKSVTISPMVESFNVYDDGGKNGAYSNNASGCLVLTAPENFVMQVTGTVETYNSSDRLVVYDGSTSSSYLSNVSSSNYDVGTLMSSNNVVTFCFNSNGSGNSRGLDLMVTLVPPPSFDLTIASVDNGHVDGPAGMVYAGSTIKLTVSPDAGYFLGSIKVEDSEGNPVEAVIGTDATGSIVSFTMPNDAVTVTPVFATPTVVSFDENGCLNNGTYFHLVCDADACMLSQELVETPQTGVDFKCWNFGTVWDGTKSIKLASDLDFGGYDATAGECAMKSYAPLTFDGNNAEFDGQGHTVKNLCYVDNTGTSTTGAVGFLNGAVAVRNINFDNPHGGLCPPFPRYGWGGYVRRR